MNSVNMSQKDKTRLQDISANWNKPGEEVSSVNHITANDLRLLFTCDDKFAGCVSQLIISQLETNKSLKNAVCNLLTARIPSQTQQAPNISSDISGELEALKNRLKKAEEEIAELKASAQKLPLEQDACVQKSESTAKPEKVQIHTEPAPPAPECVPPECIQEVEKTDFSAEVARLQRELDAEKEKNAELETAKANLEARNKSLAEENQKWKTEISTLTQQRDEAQSISKSVFDALSKIDSTPETFADDYLGLQSSLEKTQNDKRELEEDMGKKKDEIKKLKSEIEDYKSELKKVKKELEEKTKEADKKISELKRQRGELEKSKAQVEADLQTQTRQYNTLQTDMDQTRHELAAAHNDLLGTQQRLRNAEAELQQTQTTLQTTQATLKTTEANLQTTQTAQRKAEQERDRFQEECRTLSTQRERLQKECAELDAQRLATHEQLNELSASALSPAIVAELRAQPELRRRLNMGELDADPVLAMRRSVAVLSQKKNVEYLHTALKDACEKEKRSASAAERELLRFALACFDLQSAQDACQVVEVSPGQKYDFNIHEYSATTPSGTTVAATWLPGVQDGKGKVWLKPLVTKK